MVEPLTVLIGISFSPSMEERAAVHLDRVLVVADLGRARWKDQVLHADRVDDVGGGEALRLERREVEIHLDLTLLAAVGEGDGRALDGGELRPDEVVAGVEELLLGEAASRESELEDRGRSTRCSVMMKGGVVPGGIDRTADCEIAVTCATASAMWTAG